MKDISVTSVIYLSGNSWMLSNPRKYKMCMVKEGITGNHDF